MLAEACQIDSGHEALWPLDEDIEPSEEENWQWAEQVYGGARFCDARLTKRLVKAAAAMAARPLDTLPQAHDGLWAETKGIYRFISNKRVTKEAILRSICEDTARRCVGHETILLVQDTTTVVFPTAIEAAKEMGHVNQSDAPAVLMHTTLAVSMTGVVLGVLDVNIWTRDFADRGKKKSRSRPIEEKESYKWINGIAQAEKVFDEAGLSDQRPRIIDVADCESDVHEIFADAEQRPNSAVVIRATRPRRIVGDDGESLDWAYEKVARQKSLGQRIVDVPRRGGRESRSARQARVELRSCEVELSPRDPHNRQREPLKLGLVEVVEVQADKSVKDPLHWRLWTTEPAGTLREALRVVDIYRHRWKIEDYHLVLKSGCKIEDLRMHKLERIVKTIAIYAPIAARIVTLRDLARREPDQPCTVVLGEIEWKALWTVIHKAPPTPETRPPTIKQATLWIGKLGGHLGRKGDGMPGVTTLWRGLRDLQLHSTMYQALTERR